MSAATRSEVDVIASIIESSSVRDRLILERGPDYRDRLHEIFQPERAERADGLIAVVADWVAALPPERPPATLAEVHPRPTLEPSTNPLDPSAGLATPAFLRSDRVDEDDSARLFGSAGRYVRLVLGVTSVMLLAAVGVGVWLWANSRGADQVATTEDAEAVADAADGLAGTDGTGAPAPTVEPTSMPAPAMSNERVSWADTTTVLNRGTATILASTYPVSPTNRAVLTGHAGAVTGIVVTDEGRVLTSGADSLLVDWGVDVLVANRDVLEVDAPLTRLARTTDQRLIAGDTNGDVTVIDLATPSEPTVIDVHDVAVSSIAQLADGQVAVASVDGDVAVFALDSPADPSILTHSAEVTAVVGLADGSVATASVDGIVRVWEPSGGLPVGTISSLEAPVTALRQLTDGRLAAASVDGRVHVLAPTPNAVPELTIDAHDGAVRALFEFDDDRFGPTLATGSDDSTIGLYSLSTGQLWQQLDGHGDLVSAIAQLPDGRLVSTSGDRTGRVWDLELVGGPTVVTPHEVNLSHLAGWSNDQFITGGADGLVVLASTSEATSPELITRHGAPIVGLTVMPNSDIVSVDASSLLRLYQIGPDAADPFELQLAPGVTSLDSLGGAGVVTGHADGTVRLSDLTAETAVFDVHGSSVNDVLALSNGWIASAGNDNTVRVIDPQQPDLVPVFDLHTAPVTALTELPDGRIASAGSDAIYVWSLDDMGADHARLSGHRARVLSLVGLPGTRLLSAADDGRVRLWDLASPTNDAVTLIDVPGIINPALVQADNGLFIAGAGRGYVVFSLD